MNPTPSPDPRRDVADSADAFMAELTDWAANYHSERSTNICGPLAGVVAALSTVAPKTLVERFEQECLLLIAEHEKWLAVPGTNNLLSMPATALAPAWAALDKALTPFDGQLLAAALRELQAAEAEHDALQQRLEAALGRADVEAVRELREAVELTAPTRVAEARGRLRDLEVEQARAALERPTRRWEEATAEAARLSAAQADAEEAWKAATDAARVANERRLAPAKVHTQAQQRLQSAERARATEAATAAADKQARLRRLTGVAG
jgi:hypothetical protein